MVTKVSSPSPAASQRGRGLPPIEAAAMVALRPMTHDELARAVQVLKAGGMAEIRPARVMLSQRDARTVASGGFTPVDVTLVAAPRPDTAPVASPESHLEQALTEAHARWVALTETLLANPRC
jgi:hypothetical protein